MHNGNMTRLQDLHVGGILRGLIPGQSVTLRHVELHSEDVASVTRLDRRDGFVPFGTAHAGTFGHRIRQPMA